MPITVPRVVFPSARIVELDEVEIGEPAPNQMLVRATRSLISAGTERNILENDRGPARVPGYSWVGVVETLGTGVEEYAVGDRVVTYLGHQGAGLIDVGPEAPDRVAYAGRIPDGVRDEDASFVILGDVALHGVRRAAPHLGDSVAVFGQGVVGQMVTQFARLAGAYPVIAVDLLDERLERSTTSGATHTVNAQTTDAVEAIHEITAGEGARVVFMVTRTPKILPDCMRAAAAGGTVSMSGSPPGTVAIRLQEELLRKELRIIGTHQGHYPREPYHMFPWTRANNRTYIMGLMQRGEYSVAHLITHQVAFSEAPEMYGMVARGPEGWLGIVLEWDGA